MMRRAKAVIPIVAVVLGTLALFGCDRTTPPAATQPAARPPTSQKQADLPPELAADDVVFSRNLGPMKGDYGVLPDEYRLGIAYFRSPPEWWKQIATAQRFEDQAKTFPLAFVGHWTSESGKDRLVVLQMRHRFNGDGYYRPGPALWLAAYVFERTPADKWSVLWSDDNALNLHSMQNARMLAGRWEQKPGTISLRIEQKDMQAKTNPTIVTGTISREGTITFTPAGNY